jgi:hypothetical protein
LPAIVAAAITVVNARIVVQVCSLRKFSQANRAGFGRGACDLLLHRRLLGLELSGESSLALHLFGIALSGESSHALFFLSLGLCRYLSVRT